MDNQDKQILEMMKGPLETLVKTHISGDVEPEKVIQYSKARRNWLYYQGQQYLYPVRRDNQIVDWANAPQATSSAGRGDGRKTYDYCINEYRGFVDKATAILAQKSPNVKAIADRPDDDSAAKRVIKADMIAATLRSNWDIDTLFQDLAQGLCIDSTMFLHTPFVADESKYGFTSEPLIEMQEQSLGDPYFECSRCGNQSPVEEVQQTSTCVGCGSPLGPEDYRKADTMEMPVNVGDKRYANGCVELHVCDITTVTTPFYIKSLDDSPYLRYERELHKAKLLAKFPQLAEEIKKDSGSPTYMDTNMGRTTRDMQSSPYGIMVAPRKNTMTLSEYWIIPDLVEACMTGDGDKQIKEWFKSECKSGAKLTFVNGKLMSLPEDAKLTEEWVAVKPRPSKYLYADPLMADYVGIQDWVNDFHNMMKEMGDRNIPITLFHPQLLNQEVLNKHRATPMEFMPVLPTAGTTLRESLWTTPTVQIDPNMPNWVSSVSSRGQEIIGVTPAAYGGISSVQKTAAQAEMDRNQSLQQLGLPWNSVRVGISRAHENAVIQLAKHSNGKLVQIRRTSMQPTIVDVGDLQDLLQGGWHYKCEEAMPMTYGQKRDNWRQMLTDASQNQILAGIIGADDPENAQIAQDMLGMAEWKVPMLDALYKARDVISQLSKQAPVQQGMPDGSVQKVPSIPIDEFEDDHNFMSRVVREWAQTAKARQLRLDNPDGYDNVIAWGLAHFKLTQPPPPPPEGGPAGPPPPGAGGTPEPPGPVGPEGSPAPAPPPDANSQGATSPAPAPATA